MMERNDLGDGFGFGVALTNLGTKNLVYTEHADSKDYIPANFGNRLVPITKNFSMRNNKFNLRNGYQ
jgi:hypothetical protein